MCVAAQEAEGKIPDPAVINTTALGAPVDKPGLSCRVRGAATHNGARRTTTATSISGCAQACDETEGCSQVEFAFTGAKAGVCHLFLTCTM